MCSSPLPWKARSMQRRSNASAAGCASWPKAPMAPPPPRRMKSSSSNNIFMIPDFLCNAGGVTVSYFEGVQNDMNFYWSGEEVLERLDTKMTQAFHSVLEMSESEKVYMRDAAYMVAIDRVVKAMELRGWL